MAMLTLRVRDEIEARIADLAKTSGRTKTYWVTRMIELGLAELEYELWQEQALKAFLDKKKATAKELENDINMVTEFDAWLMEAEGNPELQRRTAEAAGTRPPTNPSKTRKPGWITRAKVWIEGFDRKFVWIPKPSSWGLPGAHSLR